MKNKTRVKLAIIPVIIIILIFIWIFRIDRLGFQSMKWGDIIRLNNTNYIGQYIDNNSRKQVDENMIDQKIGETKYKLQGNVRSSIYIMRNMDATILEKGTELYKIKDETTDKKIAVKFDSGYYLYISD